VTCVAIEGFMEVGCCAQCMARKTISVTLEAYKRLQAMKRPKESFSDLVIRLTERRALADFGGMLGHSSVETIREAIKKSRQERGTLDA